MKEKHNIRGLLRGLATAALLLSLVLAFASCGLPSNSGLSEQEMADIHRTEAELRARLAGHTWHVEEEISHAYRFNEDGTAEEYPGPSIQWVEPYSYDVRFCNYYDQDASGLADHDREYIEKYYHYSVLLTYAGDDSSGSTAVETISFDGDKLKMGAQTLVQGVDFIKTMPEDLSVDESFLNRVLYDADNNDFRLFFRDGTGFRCNGVFLDGTLLNEEKFYWGVRDGMLYYMIPNQPGGEGPILQEVDCFSLEQDGDTYRLTDYWTGTVRTMTDADPENDSAMRLMHNYEMLRDRMPEWGY